MDENTKALIEGYLFALDTIYVEQEHLTAEAKRVADEFWAFHHSNNGKRPLQERSQLACRVRPANGGVVRIEWMETIWRYSDNSPPKPYYRYIRKGRSTAQYPMSRLRQLAKDWEWDVVVKCEEAFAAIRALSGQAGRIRTALRAHLRRFGVNIDSVPDHIDDDD